MIPVRIVYIKYQIFERTPKRDVHFLLLTSIVYGPEFKGSKGWKSTGNPVPTKQIRNENEIKTNIKLGPGFVEKKSWI